MFNHRWIPKNAEEVSAGLGDVTAYITPHKRNPKYPIHLLAYAGKAQKPTLNYLCRSPEEASKHLLELVQGRRANKQRTLERRQARNQPHTLKLGDILYTCWGYDQTNTEFYEVVAVKPKSVVVREVKCQVVSNGTTSEGIVASPGDYCGEPSTHRVNAEQKSIRISSCQTAWLWDGRPKTVTAFGFGH